MKKHKICVIGDGLSGLITAQKLCNLDIEIDLISKGQIDLEYDNRTTAISPSNLKFILENLPKKAENSRNFRKFKFSPKDLFGVVCGLSGL